MTNATPNAETQSTSLYHTVRRAREMTETAGLAALAEAIRKDCQASLESPLFTVVVLGPFNAGKSSLINALLGRPLLAVGVLPTTAVVTEIVHGTAEGFDVHFADGSEALGRPLAELGQASQGGAEVSRIVVRVDAPWLERGVRIVDTPGVESVNEQHDRITFGYLPVADAVVLCMPSSKPLSRRDLELLRDRVLAQDINKLFFVLGQSDRLTAAEAEEVERFAAEELKAVVADPRVYCLSAHDALVARASGDQRGLEHSGLPNFEAALHGFLAEGKQAERERRVRRLLDRHLASADDAIAIELAALATSDGKMAEAAERARSAFTAAQRQEESILGELSEGVSEVRQAARQAAGAALARVASSTAVRLEDASFDELRNGASLEAAIKADLQTALQSVVAEVAHRLEQLRSRAGVSITLSLEHLREDALGALNVTVPKGGVLNIPDELFMVAEILVLDVLLPGGLIMAIVAKLVGRLLSPRLGDAIGNLLKSLVVTFARRKLQAAVAEGLGQVGTEVEGALDQQVAAVGEQLQSAAGERLGEARRELEEALTRAVETRKASGSTLAARRQVLEAARLDLASLRPVEGAADQQLAA